MKPIRIPENMRSGEGTHAVWMNLIMNECRYEEAMRNYRTFSSCLNCNCHVVHQLLNIVRPTLQYVLFGIISIYWFSNNSYIIFKIYWISKVDVRSELVVDSWP